MMRDASSAAIPVGLAFGSNIGDRLANLSAAKELLLRHPAVAGNGIFSPVFETAPVECEDGASTFLNAVGEIQFSGSPLECLAICQSIELQLGRPSRRPKNAPRTIDLDLIYAGATVIEDVDLTLPHPRLGERRFVLEPLASIRPHLVLPDDCSPIAERLSALVSDEPTLSIFASEW